MLNPWYDIKDISQLRLKLLSRMIPIHNFHQRWRKIIKASLNLWYGRENRFKLGLKLPKSESYPQFPSEMEEENKSIESLVRSLQ
jgi:hypothetical protein